MLPEKIDKNGAILCILSVLKCLITNLKIHNFNDQLTTKNILNIFSLIPIRCVQKPICDIVFCVMSFLFRCFDFLLLCFEFLVYAFCVRCCSF